MYWSLTNKNSHYQIFQVILECLAILFFNQKICRETFINYNSSCQRIFFFSFLQLLFYPQGYFFRVWPCQISPLNKNYNFYSFSYSSASQIQLFLVRHLLSLDILYILNDYNVNLESSWLLKIDIKNILYLLAFLLT